MPSVDPSLQFKVEKQESSTRKRSSWWSRSDVMVRALLLLVGISLFILLLYSQRPDDDSTNLGNNLLVFFLVNFNIITLCILVFLVGRNVVKLIFERRKNILGSKLRMKLVVAFVGLTLVPTIILFTLASGLLTRAMEGWFNGQVESAVDSAVIVAQRHFTLLKDNVDRETKEISEIFSTISPESRQRVLEKTRQENNLFSIKVFDSHKKIEIQVENATASLDMFQEPPPNSEVFRQALGGKASTISETEASSRFIRGYAPIKQNNRITGVLLVTFRVDAELTDAFTVANDSYSSYEQLKLFRHPLRSGYILTLALITGMILFAALWISFYIARQIVVPIQRLAEAAEAVGKGHYDVAIAEGGNDEIGYLVRSFNKMTSDLNHSQQEGESRRSLIEAIFTNLAVAVISLDKDQKITSCNDASYRLLGQGEVVGRFLKDVMSVSDFDVIHNLLDQAEGGKEAEAVDTPLTISAPGREIQVVCTAGSVRDATGEWLGTVLLLDDVTELSKAQQMSAWREVAQRIAHEIKNPLTPIQLSAQRLLKLVKDLPDNKTITDCAATIVENVDSIKRLTNEFSNFARMPSAEFKQANVDNLVSDVIGDFAGNHTSIIFQFVAGGLPEISVDSEQIRRVLINLIDNAIGSFGENAQRGFIPKIEIKTEYNRRSKMASIEVADNGAGISHSDKLRIFDPYFTTKKSGTGLGLAVVTSIISDHHGQIRVFDNFPKGTKFLVRLPMNQKSATLRRFETDIA